MPFHFDVQYWTFDVPLASPQPAAATSGVLDSPTAYALAALAAFCIGMSKAGFSGISLVSVFLLADLYGAKPSVGIALPMLIVADLIVYPAFLRHGSWKPVWKLLPATLLGIGTGWWLLDAISNETARKSIGICILSMIALQALRSWKPGLTGRLAASRAFGTSAGFAGGVTTTLANAAGPVIQLYLLSRRIPKMELLGIAARFFLLVNLLKLPLTHQLNLITAQSLTENAKLLPAVFTGVFGGKWLIQRVSQRVFEWMIVGFSLLAALRLIVF